MCCCGALGSLLVCCSSIYSVHRCFDLDSSIILPFSAISASFAIFVLSILSFFFCKVNTQIGFCGSWLLGNILKQVQNLLSLCKVSLTVALISEVHQPQMFDSIIFVIFASPCCGAAFRNSRGLWARRLVDNLETPRCASNGPVGSLAVKTISQGRGGCSNKNDTCVNVHQTKKANDSASNMNGLSTSPLMCLFISEHIKAGCVMLGAA